MPDLDLVYIGWLFWGTLWTFYGKEWEEELVEEGLGEEMWDWSKETTICEGYGVETIVGDCWETTAKFWNTIGDLLGEGGWVGGMGTIRIKANGNDDEDKFVGFNVVENKSG